MNNTYQTGQAVITLIDNKPRLLFIDSEERILGYDACSLDGSFECVISDDSRPATEAEILADAERHGWEKDESQENGEWWTPKSNLFYIGKIDRWCYFKWICHTL